MLNVFTLANGRLFQEEIDQLADLPPVNPVWVDLEDPTPEEKGWIALRFNLIIPQDIIDDDLALMRAIDRKAAQYHHGNRLRHVAANPARHIAVRDQNV